MSIVNYYLHALLITEFSRTQRRYYSGAHPELLFFINVQIVQGSKRMLQFHEIIR